MREKYLYRLKSHIGGAAVFGYTSELAARSDMVKINQQQLDAFNEGEDIESQFINLAVPGDVSVVDDDNAPTEPETYVPPPPEPERSIYDKKMPGGDTVLGANPAPEPVPEPKPTPEAEPAPEPKVEPEPEPEPTPEPTQESEVVELNVDDMTKNAISRYARTEFKADISTKLLKEEMVDQLQALIDKRG